MAPLIPDRYKRTLIKWKNLIYIIGITVFVLYLYYLIVDGYRKNHKSILKDPNLHVHFLNSKHWIFADVTKYPMNKKGIVVNSIAIGLAITSKQCQWENEDNIKQTFPLFNILLPSFCKTASDGFTYIFFLAFDEHDSFFTKRINLVKMQHIFSVYVEHNCPSKSNYAMHFVWCGHDGQPARAQNDAMMAAYMNNMEYYYRINDDTQMISSGWTELFIDKLKSFDPPFVGVVGPNHTGGLTFFLAYDFVHYTHIEIHGYYYPRFMTDWFADVWITDVYKPDRSLKIPNVHLYHTRQLGERYTGNTDPLMNKNTKKAVEAGKKLIKRYCNTKTQKLHIQKENTISLSLGGNNPKEIYGAIRNLQLWPIVYPRWKLRIYMLNPDRQNNNIPSIKLLLVQKQVIRKLKYLGAELVFIDDMYADIPIPLWKYFVAGDDKIKHFFARNNRQRFSENDAFLVEKLLGKRETQPVFCVSDKLESKHVVDGLFGAVSSQFRKHILGNIRQVLLRFSKQSKISRGNAENIFLNSVIWTKLHKNNISVQCYDQNDNYFAGTNSSVYNTVSLYNENEEELTKETKTVWQNAAAYVKKLLRTDKKMNPFTSI